MVKKINLTKNLYLFIQTQERHLHSNTYLLKGKPNILIDAGFLINEKVDLIILTHCHVDHHKFAEEYQKNGAKIAASKKAAKELEKASEIVAPKKFCNFFKTILKPINVDVILKSGQIIENGNFKLKVLNTPGHTPGSISLFDEEKGILFSGDTWYGDDVVGTWNHFGGNFNKLQKSVSLLKSLNPKILCPGHGDVVEKLLS